MDFSERVRQLRKENHMTQKELANILGMAKGTITMWEAGTRKPGFETLMRLSEIFDRSAEYILGNSDDAISSKMSEEDIEQLGRWTTEEDFAEVIMKYLRLDERGKAAVESLINTEFSYCRTENKLYPREYFLLSLRVKKD